MIGLLEGMLVPQPKAGQTSNTQQAVSAEADERPNADGSVSPEAFLSVLSQQLVAPVMNQTPTPIPSQEMTTANPLTHDAIIADLSSQQNIGSVLNSLAPIGVSVDAFRLQEEGLSIPPALMKPIKPEMWSDANLPVNDQEQSAHMPGVEEGFQNLNRSNEATQRIDAQPATTSEKVQQDQSRLAVSRQDASVQTTGQTAGHTSGQKQLTALDALASKEDIRVSVIDSQSRFASAGMTSVSPESLAALKYIAEKFSPVLPMNTATPTVKTRETELVATRTGNELRLEQRLDVNDQSTIANGGKLVQADPELPSSIESATFELSLAPLKSARKSEATEAKTDRAISQAETMPAIKEQVTTGTPANTRESQSDQNQHRVEQAPNDQQDRDQERSNQTPNDSARESDRNAGAKDAATNRSSFVAESGNSAAQTVKPVAGEIAVSFVQPKAQTVSVSQESTQLFSAPPALPDDFARNLMLKISDEVKLHVEGKSSEVRVMMKPESLGELSLRVTMHEGKLVALMDVTQQAVKNALEAQLPQMREALASQGIEIHRFDIVSGGDAQYGQPSEGSAAFQQQRSKRHVNVEIADESDAVKYLGYNTIEYII
ncbi:MAG: flagellar hook-length control protein FliK [Ignavibacteriae bacterium]|nr:flagellar hook-length control protein FliK [Ignavibacteriota bacterium]